jgi:WD40 repeat protein
VVENAHHGAIMELCAQGELLVSAGDDGRACFWNTSTWALLGEIRHDIPEVSAVNSAEFVGSSQLLTSCDDQRAYLWKLDRDGEGLQPPGDHSCVEVVPGHHWIVMAARASPTDPSLVATAGFDGGVRLWRIGAGPQRTLRDGGGGLDDLQFLSACWSANGRQLWTGNDEGGVICWDVETGTVVQQFRFRAGPVTDCQCSPSGRMAFVSHDEVAICDDETARRMSWQVEGVGRLWRARWLDDEKLVLSNSAGNLTWYGADGQRLVTAETGREAWALTTLSCGRVIVGTRDGALLAVEQSLGA